MGCIWEVRGGKLLDNTGHLGGSIMVMSFPKPHGEIEKEKTVQPVTDFVTVQPLPQIVLQCL